MNNQSNLKPWKSGQSGNSAGKPKGTKHLSTWIQEMLNDPNFTTLIRDRSLGYREHNGAPLKAIINTLIIKSINGDIRSFDILCKYGYGTKIDVTSQNEAVVIPILSGITKSTDNKNIYPVSKAK